MYTTAIWGLWTILFTKAGLVHHLPCCIICWCRGTLIHIKEMVHLKMSRFLRLLHQFHYMACQVIHRLHSVALRAIGRYCCCVCVWGVEHTSVCGSKGKTRTKILTHTLSLLMLYTNLRRLSYRSFFLRLLNPLFQTTWWYVYKITYTKRQT